MTIDLKQFAEQVNQIGGVEVYTYNDDNLLAKVENKTTTNEDLKMIKFKTRHIDDLYNLADPKHEDASRVVISKFIGLTKGCVLCYVPNDDAFVVWSIYRHDGFKNTTSGTYAKIDGNQKLSEMLVRPNSHNEDALNQAYEHFNARMSSCS